MKDKILFTDMDGTLLNDDKEISEEVYQAIDRFTKAGGRLVLSSGRPLSSILETKDRLGLSYPGMYVIAYNGALVYDCQADKPVFEKKLSLEVVRQAMDIAREFGIHCQTYSNTHILAEQNSKELLAYRKHIHLPYRITEDVAEYLKAMGMEPYKLIAIENVPEKLEELKQALSKRLNEKIHAIYSAKNYLEIIHKDASKGNGVRFLCEYLKIPIEAAVAAGDAANDISMLKAAGTGVAMKNATQDTKQAADYVTEHTNNEDGILELFDRWLDVSKAFVNHATT